LILLVFYGLMAYTVTQRSKEIGIRMALGAQRWNVLDLVVGQSLRLTALGIALGLVGATGVTRYLEGMSFGVTALDWWRLSRCRSRSPAWRRSPRTCLRDTQRG
jgi:ABC-type antimicrobial peptide transport system permease subunit